LESGINICPAKAGNLAEMAQLDRTPDSERRLAQSILNRCCLVARSGDELIASGGLDLDRKEIIQLRIRKSVSELVAARRLLEELERLAVQYGILELSVAATAGTRKCLAACGYRYEPESIPAGTRIMKRSFRRRQTHYSRRIFKLLERLGISPDYAVKHRMPLQPEATRLASIGPDVFKREQRLLPAAALAWKRLTRAADKDGIELMAVSAYRPVDYQAGIVQRKLEKGQSMEQILKVSAAPGFSEHHTGRAIDVTTPGFAVLEEEFEGSPAFDWLCRNAPDFGFQLSYPRNNRHGVAYEPWHWAWDRT